MRSQMNGTPPGSENIPPPLLAAVTPGKPSFLRQALALGLSLCLWLFLVDGLVSFADDTLMVLLRVHVLSGLRVVVGLLALLLAVPVYFLMGLTPMIAKRIFLPLTLFYLLTQLAALPAFIYFYAHFQACLWLLSGAQVVLGWVLLRRVFGGGEMCALPVTAESLGARKFSWRNSIGFVLANVFGLLPFVTVFFIVCTGLAIHHVTEGFVSLHPSGLSMQTRKYVRADGKTVQLYPMGHMGDAAFYQKLSRSFPSNSIILMEGVHDEHNLLTNGISYQRVAHKLGLSEQREQFEPEQGELVNADVDVSEFRPDTIATLNFIMLLYAKGLNPERLQQLLTFAEPVGLEQTLLDDLLHKRNQHLLAELQKHLPDTDQIVIPWGAGHMPEISHEIEKSGFHLTETQNLMIVRFFGKTTVAREPEKPIGVKNPP
jgi:hypothetical protein